MSLLKNLIILLFLFSPIGSAWALSVGDKAPEFQAWDQDDKRWSLEAHLGKKPLVVYFYPAAMTGGCTRQACSYRDYLKEQEVEAAFEIVGISGDTPENLRHFRAAEGLNFTLLSDADGKIAEAFGVTVKAGEKTIQRVLDGKDISLSRSVTTSRSTFILNAEGRVTYIDSKVEATADLANVLKHLKQSK